MSFSFTRGSGAWQNTETLGVTLLVGGATTGSIQYLYSSGTNHEVLYPYQPKGSNEYSAFFTFTSTNNDLAQSLTGTIEVTLTPQ